MVWLNDIDKKSIYDVSIVTPADNKFINLIELKLHTIRKINAKKICYKNNRQSRQIDRPMPLNNIAALK